MRNYKILFWTVLISVTLIILYFSTIIVHAILTDYQPNEITSLEIAGKAGKNNVSDSTFTFLSWNIGFAGMGAEMDFFYDGGENVHPSDRLLKKYTSGILNFIQSADTVDFILLQEVDRNSTRSNYQDQISSIQQLMPDYSTSFAINYKVEYVPLPFFNPVGKVEMGQLNLSKYQPVKSLRRSFYSAYSWPKNLFMLDRCFIVSYFHLANTKKLVLINTHNSAYDTGGKLRYQEMPVIRDFMLAEYKMGNYVIAGGDWNQNPPQYNLSEMNSGYHPVKRETLDSFLFPDDWEIAYNPQLPTNREIDAPFSKEKTGVTIIDYYIVSPNVKIEKVKTVSNEFKFSDHEPVYLKIRIKD